MEQSEKIIIYQVFTRLFGSEDVMPTMAACRKTDVVRWPDLQTRL